MTANEQMKKKEVIDYLLMIGFEKETDNYYSNKSFHAWLNCNGLNVETNKWVNPKIVFMIPLDEIFELSDMIYLENGVNIGIGE